MGEANLRCARGETNDAIKLCMEVIRQVRFCLIYNRKNTIFNIFNFIGSYICGTFPNFEHVVWNIWRLWKIISVGFDCCPFVSSRCRWMAPISWGTSTTSNQFSNSWHNCNHRSQICLSQSDFVQAAKCFAKAATADISNLQIHQRWRAILFRVGPGTFFVTVTAPPVFFFSLVVLITAVAQPWFYSKLNLLKLD